MIGRRGFGSRGPRGEEAGALPVVLVKVKVLRLAVSGRRLRLLHRRVHAARLKGGHILWEARDDIVDVLAKLGRDVD